MTMAELTKVAKFYETDISLDAVWHERNNWFKRCSLLGDVPSIKTQNVSTHISGTHRHKRG